MTCQRVFIRGRVQGVAYRAWAQNVANELSIRGWVRNRRDGSVEALICGDGEAVDAMVARCRQGPRMANVTSVETVPESDAVRHSRFDIVETV